MIGFEIERGEDFKSFHTSELVGLVAKHINKLTL